MLWGVCCCQTDFFPWWIHQPWMIPGDFWVQLAECGPAWVSVDPPNRKHQDWVWEGDCMGSLRPWCCNKTHYFKIRPWRLILAHFPDMELNTHTRWRLCSESAGFLFWNRETSHPPSLTSPEQQGGGQRCRCTVGTVQLLRYSSMYVKDGLSNHDEYLVVSGIWRGGTLALALLSN